MEGYVYALVQYAAIAPRMVHGRIDRDRLKSIVFLLAKARGFKPRDSVILLGMHTDMYLRI